MLKKGQVIRWSGVTAWHEVLRVTENSAKVQPVGKIRKKIAGREIKATPRSFLISPYTEAEVKQ